MEAVDIADGYTANLGFVARRAHITQNHVDEMMVQPHMDLFLQDQFLLNCVDVKLRLVRSREAFVRTAGGANPHYKVQIVDGALFANKSTLGPTVQITHIKARDKRTVKYPMRSVDCKVNSILRGARSHTHGNLPRYPA